MRIVRWLRRPEQGVRHVLSRSELEFEGAIGFGSWAAVCVFGEAVDECHCRRSQGAVRLEDEREEFDLEALAHVGVVAVPFV